MRGLPRVGPRGFSSLILKGGWSSELVRKVRPGLARGFPQLLLAGSPASGAGLPQPQIPNKRSQGKFLAKVPKLNLPSGGSNVKFPCEDCKRKFSSDSKCESFESVVSKLKIRTNNFQASFPSRIRQANVPNWKVPSNMRETSIPNESPKDKVPTLIMSRLPFLNKRFHAKAVGNFS